MIFLKAAFIVTAAFLRSASALEGAVVLKDDSTLDLSSTSNDSTLSDPISLRGASETSAQAGLPRCIVTSNCPEGYHCDGIVGNRFCEPNRAIGKLCDEDNDCISGRCRYIIGWFDPWWRTCGDSSCECVHDGPS